MNTKTFTDFLQTGAAAIQSSASKLVNLTVGSVMRALLEACSQFAMFLQSLIVYVASITRLSTSSGSDVDSFVADFGLTREAAVAATGTVTFSRSSTTQAAVIPVGAQVQSQDGSVTFSVIADTSNANYDSTTEQYTIPAGTASLGILVQCDTAGSVGNVQASTINTLTSAIPGIDSVTNAAAFTNGVDEETDEALKARFALYIAGLRQATKTAIESAIDDLQQGLSYQVVENQTKTGGTQLGYFYVVVDDGTGSPSATLLATVNTAIDAVRGLTITYGVFAPTVVNATVAMTVTVSATANASTVKGLVQTALQNYINSLTLGETLYYTRLAQVAYDASSDVVNVSGVTLNGGTADLTASVQEVIKYNSVTIS